MPRPVNPRLRDDLLDAAIILLDRQGPSFSIRDLSAEINYSTTAVYRCFASRGDLLKAVQLRLFEDFATRLMAHYRPDGDVADQILSSGRSFIQFGVAHPTRYTFMFQDAGPDALLADEERALATAPLVALEAMVTQAMATGEIDDGDAKSLALMFFASVHGLVSLHLAQRLLGFTQASPTETYEQWAQMWLQQLRPRTES